MATKWRSAGDMPAEGELVLVRLRPDPKMNPIWPEDKPCLAAACVCRKDLDVVYCFANNLCTIPARFVITGWMPMAEAMEALGDQLTDTDKIEAQERAAAVGDPVRSRMGTGAAALAREADDDEQQPCRVRRIVDGRYLICFPGDRPGEVNARSRGITG